MNNFSSTIDSIPLSSITINRDERQRTAAEPDEGLLTSIRERGLINPIIVTRQLVLKAGERRLEAHKRLGLATIAVRYVEDLDPLELQILELEENLHRASLDWKDESRAIATIHALFLARDPEWTMAETASAIGKTLSWVSMNLQVAGKVGQGDERVSEAKGLFPAYNIMARRKQRESAKQLEELLTPMTPDTGGSGEAREEAIVQPDGTIVMTRVEPSRASAPAEPPEDILHQSFLEWAPQYRGDKFNLVHCDFPYGVNFAHGEQGGKGQDGIYEDSRDVYFELLESFCDNLDNFASLSCHFIFWFSMKHYEATKALFRNKAPGIEWVPHPLVWGKSDNAGIIGDVKRHPRHTYECALFGYRGSRNILQSVADFYSAPTDRSLHPSTKPEPMLRHFFRMVVDEQSEVLDPTCGSAASLRAAESLGAKRVLGLEIDPTHVETARQALRNSRRMRDAARVVG